MKPHLKLTFSSIICMTAFGAMVSCKDEPEASPPTSGETAKPTPPPIIASLDGTIGDISISTSLDMRHSKISIEEWDGISTENEDRDSKEMSLDAFLMGTALWSGPPRLVTINHDIDDISLNIRFAGRLAVDEELDALPGCLLEPNDQSLVPIANGSWKTATNVTLPHYDLRFIVISYDESTETVSGMIKGQLIDPTNPQAEPIPVNLTLASEKTPKIVGTAESPEDAIAGENTEPETVNTEPTITEPADTKTVATEPEDLSPEDTETEETETNAQDNIVTTPSADESPDDTEVRVAIPAKEEDQEEEEVEVRRAVPVPPKDRIGF